MTRFVLTRRELAFSGLAAFAGGSALAAPSPATFDVTPFVHPDLRAMVAPMRAQIGSDLNAQTLAQNRKQMMAYMGAPLPAPGWAQVMLPGRKDQPTVRVYAINAGQKDKPRPAIVHMHGGGYVLGEAKISLRSMQEVAAALDCVVVTVDYRLAPEVRFPGALEDNYTALKWVYDQAAILGVDRSRIAVMGESAGGGHAAMLAIAARDRGEVPLCYQALVYPMLDDRTGSTVRKPPWMGALVWNEAKNRYGWSSLLGQPAGSAKVPPGSVPARVADLKALPPTFIGVGSIDLFVDEDVDYARRLLDAGVACELVVIPGGFHGFDNFQGAPVVKRYREHFMAALRQGLKV
ncbi:alpha/beta hydrolase [Novosphingobium sp.]|uniref:alpha/beta hydrolase n=1 Tax=Novosphingobium sp. TaxID=1874826 RepID=UPI0025E41EF4|nr:alpha/beta hydrolase [Novosphingobium sp.]